MVHQPELLLVNVLYVLIHAGDESGISLAGTDPAGFFFELVEAIQSILHQHLGIKELIALGFGTGAGFASRLLSI